MTLIKFGVWRMPDTTKLYDEYTRALSVGQGYFRAIFDAKASLQPHKIKTIEGLITDVNTEFITKNLESK